MDGGRNLTFGKKYGYKRDWKAAQRYGIERVFFFSIENRNLPVHQVELSITVLPGEDFIWSLASQQSLIKV